MPGFSFVLCFASKRRSKLQSKQGSSKGSRCVCYIYNFIFILTSVLVKMDHVVFERVFARGASDEKSCVLVVLSRPLLKRPSGGIERVWNRRVPNVWHASIPPKNWDGSTRAHTKRIERSDSCYDFFSKTGHFSCGNFQYMKDVLWRIFLNQNVTPKVQKLPLMSESSGRIFDWLTVQSRNRSVSPFRPAPPRLLLHAPK